LHARRRRNRTANKAIDFSLDFSDLDTIGGGALSGRSEAANALAEHCEMHGEGLGGEGIGNVIEVGVLLQFHSNMSNVGLSQILSEILSELTLQLHTHFFLYLKNQTGIRIRWILTQTTDNTMPDLPSPKKNSLMKTQMHKT
jgi:hypothetical protein